MGNRVVPKYRSDWPVRVLVEKAFPGFWLLKIGRRNSSCSSSTPVHTISTPLIPGPMSATGTAPPPSTGSTKVDAIKENLKAAAPSNPTGLDLYSRFAFAGAVCCSVTHGGLTPVDV